MPARLAERRLRAVSEISDSHPAAEREAWARMAAGIEDALSVPGLSAAARAGFVRRLRLVRECAGRSTPALRDASAIADTSTTNAKMEKR